MFLKGDWIIGALTQGNFQNTENVDLKCDVGCFYDINVLSIKNDESWSYLNQGGIGIGVSPGNDRTSKGW